MAFLNSDDISTLGVVVVCLIVLIILWLNNTFFTKDNPNTDPRTGEPIRRE